MLRVNDIEVLFYGVIQVLRGVYLEVASDQITCLLGANGAGKTTTLKAISGLLHTEEGRVSVGSIEFAGQRIEKLKAEQISRLGIIQVLEGRRLFEQLTTEENLRMGGYIIQDGGTVKERLDMVYDHFPKLNALRHQISGYLSGGEQQMLVIGRALMARPKLILLDEPSLGLAPVLVDEIFRIVTRINEEDKTAILLVEQNAVAALSISQYAYVMENGRMVLDGPAEKVAENEDVKEFYLGLDQVGRRKSYREAKHYKRRKRWLA